MIKGRKKGARKSRFRYLFKWWRECIWPEGLLSPPESVVWLEEDDVVSALWGQQKKRREIRVRYLLLSILHVSFITFAAGKVEP